MVSSFYRNRKLALRNCQFHNLPIEASFKWFRLGALDFKGSNYINSFYQSIAILFMAAQHAERASQISGLKVYFTVRCLDRAER